MVSKDSLRSPQGGGLKWRAMFSKSLATMHHHRRRFEAFIIDAKIIPLIRQRVAIFPTAAVFNFLNSFS